MINFNNPEHRYWLAFAVMVVFGLIIVGYSYYVALTP